MSDRVKNVLEHKGDRIEAISREVTVRAAVERMNERRIGALLVADTYTPGQPYRPVGIFTERDVLVRVVAPGRDPATTRVGDVMTTALVTVRPDTTVAEAMAIITDRRCRHLPVVDDSGLCGLISAGDLTRWVVRDQERTINDLNDYVRSA